MLRKLPELNINDIIEIEAGLTTVVGYFVSKNDNMLYLRSTIQKPIVTDIHVPVPREVGYYLSNLEVTILRKADQCSKF